MSRKKAKLKPVMPCIWKKSNGKYIVIKQMYHPVTGRKTRKHVTTNTLAEACEALAAIMESTRPLGKDDECPTLGQMIRLAREMKKQHKNFKMISLYLEEIENYFGPSKALNQIDAFAVQKFRSHLQKQTKRSRGAGKLSNQSIDHRLKELRWILNAARREGYIQQTTHVKMLGRYGQRECNISLQDCKRQLKRGPLRSSNWDPPFMWVHG